MSDVAFIIWVAVFAATSLFWTWVLFWRGRVAGGVFPLPYLDP